MLAYMVDWHHLDTYQQEKCIEGFASEAKSPPHLGSTRTHTGHLCSRFRGALTSVGSEQLAVGSERWEAGLKLAPHQIQSSRFDLAEGRVITKSLARHPPLTLSSRFISIYPSIPTHRIGNLYEVACSNLKSLKPNFVLRHVRGFRVCQAIGVCNTTHALPRVCEEAGLIALSSTSSN